MSKVLFECKSCGKTFIHKNGKDGLNCNECKGVLVPLGYVDEMKNMIIKMQSKIEKADSSYEPLSKEAKVKDLTIKISLDTTEVKEKLDRIEKQLERIKFLQDTIRTDEGFNEATKQ